MEKTQCYLEYKLKMIQMVEEKTFTAPTMWWLDGHFQLEFDKKRQEESRKHSRE